MCCISFSECANRSQTSLNDVRIKNFHFGTKPLKVRVIFYTGFFNAIFESYLKDYCKIQSKQCRRWNITLFYSILYRNWIWQGTSYINSHSHLVIKLFKHSHKFYRAVYIFLDVTKWNSTYRIKCFIRLIKTWYKSIPSLMNFFCNCLSENIISIVFLLPLNTHCDSSRI